MLRRYGAAFDCYDMNKDGELSTEEAVKMMRDNLTEQIKFTSRVRQQKCVVLTVIVLCWHAAYPRVAVGDHPGCPVSPIADNRVCHCRIITCFG